MSLNAVGWRGKDAAPWLVLSLVFGVVLLAHMGVLVWWLGAAVPNMRHGEPVSGSPVWRVTPPPPQTMTLALPGVNQNDQVPVRGSAEPAHVAVPVVAAPSTVLSRPAIPLDEPPRPVSGWVLDPQALDRCWPCHLTVDIAVSAEGLITDWQLLSADPPGAWAIQALSPLSTTRMYPGQLNGRPQAGHVVVELAVSNESYE